MTGGSALPFGPLDKGALHVAIDMQRLFLDPGDWYCAPAHALVPGIAELAASRPGATAFTRFVPAQEPGSAAGTWQRYYRRWQGVTLERRGADCIDLVPELAGLAPPRNVFDKTTYDAFMAPAFGAALADRGATALVFTGIETDVCVLATLLSAVDRGYRSIVVTDAVASGDPAGHRATLDAILPRFDQQIECVTLADLLPEWRGLGL